MRTLSTILVCICLMAVCHAGIVGWLTSGAQNWQFIQQTGGIRIAAPIEKDGKKVLPVEYCVQGTVAITCQPTLLNSGLAVRRVELKRTDAQIVIRVVTQVMEKGSDTGRIHYVDLSSIPPGTYQVYYESSRDPTKRLGQIEIK